MRAAVCMSGGRESAALCRAIRLWSDMTCVRGEAFPWSPERGPLPDDVSVLFWDMDGASAPPPERFDGPGRFLFLCASASQTAIESYALHPAGLFKKPIRMDALRQALDRCVGAWWNDLEQMEVLCGGLRRQIPLYGLLWVESCQHGSLLHTSWERIQTREPLRDLAARLPAGAFLRCQRSFLINLYHVREVSQDSVVLSSGDRIPVGRRVRAGVLESCRDALRLWDDVLPPAERDGGVEPALE